jgi:hypothetical protein
MQSDEERILEEVKKRKERAWQSGVIRNAFKLYRENLPHYDAWVTNCPDLLHPQIKVTNKVEISGARSRGPIERVEAVIRENSYVFTFSQSSMCMPDGEEYITGKLDVDFQGQRVMTIDCGCEDDRYMGRTWSARDVSAFLEGPWIAELNSVFAEVTCLHDEHSKRSAEESKRQKLEEMKKNFGL